MTSVLSLSHQRSYSPGSNRAALDCITNGQMSLDRNGSKKRITTGVDGKTLCRSGSLLACGVTQGQNITQHVAALAMRHRLHVQTSDIYRARLVNAGGVDPAVGCTGIIVKVYQAESNNDACKCDVIWDNGRVLCGYNATEAICDLVVADLSMVGEGEDGVSYNQKSNQLEQLASNVPNTGKQFLSNDLKLEVLVGYLGKAPPVNSVGPSANIWDDGAPLSYPSRATVSSQAPEAVYALDRRPDPPSLQGTFEQNGSATEHQKLATQQRECMLSGPFGDVLHRWPSSGGGSQCSLSSGECSSQQLSARSTPSSMTAASAGDVGSVRGWNGQMC